MLITRGFRSKLANHFDIRQPLYADLHIDGPASYDCSCFGLDAAEKLADDRYMIFYNQTASPERAIDAELKDGQARFTLALAKLAPPVRKLVFTVSIDGGGTMEEIRQCRIILSQPRREALELSLTGDAFQKEKAIIAIEIYFKDEWRLNAVARGYNGGLGDLLQSFGGEAADPQPARPAAPPPRPASEAAPPARKVELKKGQKTNLQKSGAEPLGEIRINLNWNAAAGAAKKGLFSFAAKGRGVDLDLGCLYEMSDGAKGVVQALGNRFGDYQREPYIQLDSDDRTGASAGGETMRVNGRKIALFKRILVFTFIYDGVANWKQADGVITVQCPGSPDIVVKMDEYDTRKGMCAIAMLENVAGKTFSVEKIVDFYAGHQEMDRSFRWGLRWVGGSK